MVVTVTHSCLLVFISQGFGLKPPCLLNIANRTESWEGVNSFEYTLNMYWVLDVIYETKIGLWFIAS